LQYLNFLIDVGNDLALDWENMGCKPANLDNTKNDERIFSKHCDDLKTKIEETLNAPSFSQVHYLDIIRDFDDQLRSNHSFSSMTVYDTFFDNYDLFHNNPLGFVCVRKSQPNNPKYLTKDKYNREDYRPTDGKLLPALLTDAVRGYPVINVDGNTAMVYYGIKELRPGSNPNQGAKFVSFHMYFLRDYSKVPNDTFAVEAYTSNGGTWLQYFDWYGVNYEHLDYNKGKMVGVPFLSKLPFDTIVSALDRDDV